MNSHRHQWCRTAILQILLFVAVGRFGLGLADDSPDSSTEQERLETMRAHVSLIRVTAKVRNFPEKFTDQPLFRYDDLTRGYVDGAVWRLGETGRPKAIVTTELHPKYGGNPRIVCDYLSLSEIPFVARMSSGTAWTPPESAVKMEPLPDGPKLAATKVQRLIQLKKMAERFTGHQTVEGQALELRLLPRPIDRYQPSVGEDSDAAIFLLVSGRNPGILLVVEATESKWQYGVGRLSEPSTLQLDLDGVSVWRVGPAVLGWQLPYTATNFPVVIPGIE